MRDFVFAAKNKREEILKGKKGKLDGRKKRKLESSKFERELRKLEWIVNYLGGGGGRGGGGGGREGSFCRSR